MLLRTIALTLGLLFATAPPALAQKGGNGMREKVKERVRALRIAKLIEMLDMDDQTVAKIMPIINRGYDDIGLVAKESGEARRELQSLMAADKPDNDKINKLIDRLLVNKDKVEKIEGDMMREARKVLTPAQMGKMVVVLPEVNQQINRMIKRAAEGEGGGGGGGGQRRRQQGRDKPEKDDPLDE
jgi:Spy/CpxP family protein refolding chaperone